MKTKKTAPKSHATTASSPNANATHTNTKGPNTMKTTYTDPTLLANDVTTNGSTAPAPLSDSLPTASPVGADAATGPLAASVGTGAPPPALAATAQIAPPPATANIPGVPKGFVKPAGNPFAGLLPNRTEISRLALATGELSSFSNYAQTFGSTAPPYGDALLLFQATNAWTSMRVETDAWKSYAAEQEGLAWTFMRALMAQLVPAFQLALKANPQLALQMPNLSALLTAKKAVAKKAVATKAANNGAVAAGHAPVHGTVGKSRKRAAEQSAYLATQGHSTAPTPVLPVVPPQAPQQPGSGASH